ncbi:MAG TPA: N-acetyltransferase, partial [Bacteroidales bacterium]|nr:N-acetyltransferase [Bacteroidales bacterium]
MVEIKEVVSKKDKKEFVDFQFDLYKGNDKWIPPLKKDEIKQLSPQTNLAFDFCDAKFWTAWKEGKCVGRIGAIINKDYNNKIGKQMGRFTRFEVINDQDVAKKLFDTIETWLKQQGMTAIHGPLGFTNLDNQGLLIEGFDHLPSIASVMHFPFMQKLIEDEGFVKENDWVEFRLKIEEV